MLDPAYAVGVDPIDHDHAELFALIAQVEQANADVALTLKSVRDLLDFVRRHFYLEETLMTENRYPELDGHRQLHRALFRQLMEMEQALGGGDPQAAQALAAFLDDWLRQHIQVHDRRLGAFILDGA